LILKSYVNNTLPVGEGKLCM